MPRHPQNSNLHLHFGDTYEGLPVMKEKGPFIREYLARLKQTIDLALEQYPRLLAFRVDLRYPVGIDLPPEAYLNDAISRFFDSFKSKIEYNRDCAQDRNKYAHSCKVRYVWARELGFGGRPHYHLLILLNRDAYYTLGRLTSANRNMISRLEEAWASALGLPIEQVEGLVNIPVDATYRIHRPSCSDEVDELLLLFRRASYLCKSSTKSYGDRQRSFDTSRG